MAYFAVKKGIALVKLNSPPVNGLGQAVRLGLVRALERAQQEKCSAVVIAGEGKTFSAGADIAEFAKGGHLTSPSLHEVIAAMDSFDRPLVASIHGNALGGGLETALACHWRLVSPKAKIGLPEVHLGILPGAGGTQRLPRLVGVEKAIDIMTSGRMVGSKEALALGIADKIASSEASHIDEAIEFALSNDVQNTSVASRRVSGKSVPGVNLTEAYFQKLEEKVVAAARGYKAPINIFKAIKASVLSGNFAEGLKQEGALFQELMRGTQAPAMQYFFFSERRCGHIPGLQETLKPLPIESVGVIGGGTMGSGIAMCMANAGIKTSLLETTSEKAAESMKRIEKTYKSSSAYKSGKQTDDDVKALLSRIVPVTEFSAFRDTDIVIEAVFENMQIKKDIFAKLDKVCKLGAILASNTSYLDIDEIASATTRPGSVIGTHFFSPANVMKLLEVVRGRHSSPLTIATSMSLGKRIGKTSVLAGNCDGFIGNRMMKPYGGEAHFLIEEGATPSQVDRVMKRDVGLAMGPFEMIDMAGNDVNWRLRMNNGFTSGKTEAGQQAAAAKKGLPRYSSMADKLCEAGFFGQKAGRGWYHYDPANPRKPIENETTLAFIRKHREEEGISPRKITDEEILERCLFSLVNEGFKILEEGIALRPGDIDVVQVYGYGFPKYRGGPMWWAEREITLARVLTAIQNYEKQFPTQNWWRPSALLTEVVSSGATLREEMFFREKKIREEKK